MTKRNEFDVLAALALFEQGDDSELRWLAKRGRKLSPAQLAQVGRIHYANLRRKARKAGTKPKVYYQVPGLSRDIAQEYSRQYAKLKNADEARHAVVTHERFLYLRLTSDAVKRIATTERKRIAASK